MTQRTFATSSRKNVVEVIMSSDFGLVKFVDCNNTSEVTMDLIDAVAMAKWIIEDSFKP